MLDTFFPLSIFLKDILRKNQDYTRFLLKSERAVDVALDDVLSHLFIIIGFVLINLGYFLMRLSPKGSLQFSSQSKM